MTLTRRVLVGTLTVVGYAAAVTFGVCFAGVRLLTEGEVR